MSTVAIGLGIVIDSPLGNETMYRIEVLCYGSGESGKLNSGGLIMEVGPV